jgi:Fur family ferric uptake transcriptional regulator
MGIIIRMTNDNTMRMTRQRQVILEELKAMHTHPTADELHRRVRARMPSISLATVYRNLKLLAEAGFITEIRTVGAQRRYEGNVDDHYHLTCVRCGRVDDAPVPADSDLQEAVNNATGYRVLSHRVEFLGVCPACEKSSTQKPTARSGRGNRVSYKQSHNRKEFYQ